MYIAVLCRMELYHFLYACCFVRIKLKFSRIFEIIEILFEISQTKIISQNRYWYVLGIFYDLWYSKNAVSIYYYRTIYVFRKFFHNIPTKLHNVVLRIYIFLQWPYFKNYIYKCCTMKKSWQQVSIYLI